MRLIGNAVAASAGRVGVVSDGVDLATGDYIINVTAGDGTRSTSRLKEDGSVSLDVAGAVSVGRRNESRVIRTLRQSLQADGRTVSVNPGRDDRGEDSILTIDGEGYVLQIVTAPGRPDFWRQAKVRAEMPDIEEAGTVEWMRTVIETKTRKIAPKVDRGCVLFHAGRHS